jgi:predicted acyl esterase
MSDPKAPIMMYDVEVPMRDGVKLSANVFLPSRTGRFPVILNRTPYVKDSGRKERLRRLSASFAKSGYAVVHMDVRGKGKLRRDLRTEHPGDLGRIRFSGMGGHRFMVQR